MPEKMFFIDLKDENNEKIVFLMKRNQFQNILYESLF